MASNLRQPSIGNPNAETKEGPGTRFNARAQPFLHRFTMP